ncbi:D-alanyl-D-alanine carboxypeptidase family protein [Aquamicrobium sp. LC103]|uniref:D-alanyl-D-alanine carboxypeptidase family protein n=1 Tax=Aquamicrobium sp. LC103 TaxID=1120658 RepID=UPI0009E1BFC2|nr:D-alanyl-D-alanine carboxypeptidase family protein [Aquamicrobium sp. LC103]TKT82423.1 D-alanyl-D-alanine carboxypeptidase [Aquamicrobium sp. LC103]
MFFKGPPLPASPVTIRLPRFAAIVLATLLAASGCTTSSVLESSAVTPLVSEKYAAIVVDAGNGKVLFARAADEPRYPASLAKMMTLYLLFEALDAGKISLATPIPVSANAASRPPSRMGLKAGQTIDVETAIRCLATKSANDVAVAVAEFLAGSEEQFAAVMTSRARQLGMRSTVFRNASGLPDLEQRTTARDMAALSVALRKRYPHHYHYFSDRSFTYAGKVIRGHNDLIGGVAGVDGLKTGYIRASGYNVATSVRRGGRGLVVVVMGGETAKSRNAHVEELIEAYFPRTVAAAAPARISRPAPAGMPPPVAQDVVATSHAGAPGPTPPAAIGQY